ncbi:MAG: hypothetical protein ACI4JS_01600 [Oscillospiraceae bacterium]
MTALLEQYKKYTRQFICWWITTIVSIFIPFVGMLSGGEIMSYIVIIQLILAVVSIVGLTVSGAKKSSAVRDIAYRLSTENEDVYPKLIELGIPERYARVYRDRPTPTASSNSRILSESTQMYKEAARICCPNCGSENLVKARSDLEEFFWIIVLFGSTSSVTPIAVIAFGICVVLSVLLAILNKLASVTVAKLKCRSCGKKFECRSDGR